MRAPNHILLFGPSGAILPSRPLRVSAVARSGGQGRPSGNFCLNGNISRPRLDRREHGGSLDRYGISITAQHQQSIKGENHVEQAKS